MTRTRLGVTAAVLGSALLGSVSAAEWREAYAPPATSRCDLAAGYATASLIAPARHGRLASEPATSTMTEASGANPFVTARQANLGMGAAMESLNEMNGPRVSAPRQAAYER